MATPTGRLTRGTIIDQAQRLAANTSTSLKGEMRVWLNLELQDLYSQWDWPFILTTTTLTLSGLTFALPADFWRSQDDDALQITAVDGIAQRYRRVPEVDLQRYWRQYDPDTTNTTPLLWAADRSNDVGRLWPTSTAAVSAQLRYKRHVPDVATTPTATYDADLPIFPWHSYLVAKLYAMVLQWDEKPMAADALARADGMLARIRGVALPRKSVSDVVPLDPDTFLPPFEPE